MTPERKLEEFIENYATVHDMDPGDAQYEVREGEVETKLPTQFSRHYESKEVASQMLDGSWVGWTYWYGGGKHSCAESIDWIPEAYDLDVVEEEKMVVVRTFTKKETK